MLTAAGLLVSAAGIYYKHEDIKNYLSKKSPLKLLRHHL